MGQKFKPAAYESMRGGLNVLPSEGKNTSDTTVIDRGFYAAGQAKTPVEPRIDGLHADI
jgi:hypothetical protein